MKSLLLSVCLLTLSSFLHSQDSLLFTRVKRAKYYEVTNTRATNVPEGTLPVALFYVLKANGTLDTMRGTIRYMHSRKSWVLKGAGKSLLPAETHFVFRVQQEDTLYGYPERNTWLFSCMKGAIHGYSANSFFSPGTLDLSYLKKEGDTMLYRNSGRFRRNDLGTLISDDSLLYKNWQKKSRIKKSGISAIAFSGLLLGVSALTPLIKDKEHRTFTARISASGALLGCLYGFVTIMIPLNACEIIEAYNVKRMRREHFNYFHQINP